MWALGEPSGAHGWVRGFLQLLVPIDRGHLHKGCCQPPGDHRQRNGWWHWSSGPPRPEPHAPPLPADPVAPPSRTADPPDPAQEPPVPPESSSTSSDFPGLDRLGVTQAIGGLALGLIALFSSYDHITLFGHNLPLQQQWGIVFIAASVATVLVDAELASRSRLREAHARARDQDAADRERNLAGEERQSADRERNRAAESRERQRESLERLDQAALLSARVQLDPSDVNRARLNAFLTLMGQRQRDA